MRHTLIALCILTAACSKAGGPTAPTAPSGVIGATGAQTQANGGSNVEVTFTKWLSPSPPPPGAVAVFTGVAGGDAPGAFAATVLERIPFDNGNIVQLRAKYEAHATDPARAFVAEIEGKQNNQTQSAVLNGRVVNGWLTGARVHVTFDVIEPCPQFGRPRCFTGVIRVLAGSAD
jgi:hypothetical protein